MNSQILNGDWIEQLKTLESESVQCCCTSPPYWGLRDYGTAKWEGGNHDCDHKLGLMCSDKSTLKGYTSEGVKLRTNGMPYKDICGKCGAIRVDGQLGLEKTPEEYVEKMVIGFREVKRVLKDDGTLWLNLGDSYSGGGIGGHIDNKASVRDKANSINNVLSPKPKDLIGIPWRVAFALQSDGWYLRQDIIWSKPNPMPESVTDRCTKSHEYIFLLTKSSRYYYDNEAIKEDFISYNNPKSKGTRGQLQTTGARNGDRDFSGGFPYPEDGKNKRSVWTVNTKPYKEAHFATFPQEIPRTCILAGSKKGDIILDPFCGSGTTGEVALKLDRNFIGIELNQKYVNDLIIPRLDNVDPLFRMAE
jgi:DNA modification methylase